MSVTTAKTDMGGVSGAVMVVGGGIAGMQAALDLAASGFLVYLVEKNISIGGTMAQLDKTFPTNDCSTCMISPKLIEVASNPNIKIITRATVTGLAGEPGAFTAKVHQAPRFIDLEACSACGECAKVCPVEVPADFNEGLARRKAVYRHFPQAIPSAFAIDKLGLSPCKAACPAGVSAQGYVALIAQGRFREALRTERLANPLPGICGRVCTHPCESQCTRGQVDEPVAIRDLKRFIADWEAAQGVMDLPERKPLRREKVAIIGSGPAGLTAGYYLALEGFQPVIFEALPVAGGMLKVGIPDYRLPEAVLNYEIDYIRAAGVEIKLDTPLGPDLTLEDLKDQGYGAVFIAVGAHQGFRLNAPGEDLPGVRSGVLYLREAALGRAA
ncbi:MAG: NAD(P)-binding protein, partial [Thermodesulfobacteriota bacterium]